MRFNSFRSRVISSAASPAATTSQTDYSHRMYDNNMILLYYNNIILVEYIFSTLDTACTHRREMTDTIYGTHICIHSCGTYKDGIYYNTIVIVRPDRGLCHIYNMNAFDRCKYRIRSGLMYLLRPVHWLLLLPSEKLSNVFTARRRGTVSLSVFNARSATENGRTCDDVLAVSGIFTVVKLGRPNAHAALTRNDYWV